MVKQSAPTSTPRVHAYRERQRRFAQDQLMRDFETWMKFRHFSPDTRRTYANRTRRFHAELDLLKATTEDLLGVWPEGIGRSYHNGLTEALRAFYRFLKMKNLRQDNPAEAIEKVRKAKALPRRYTRPQRDAYLDAAKRLGARHHALAALGLFAGLRVAECSRLRWSDTGDRLRVKGKGDKERMVPTSLFLRAALEVWRAECPSKVWVFPPSWPRGGMRADQPASPCRLWAWHHEVLEEAGLDNQEAYQEGFHRTRHTFATEVYESTRDLLRLQKWLGHSSPAITAVYAEVADDGDAEVIEQVFGPPLAESSPGGRMTPL